MGAVKGTLAEIRELKTEITGLRTDLKRFTERANQQHIEAVICDIRKNVGDVVADHQVKTAEADLASHMERDCSMQKQCYEVFLEFLTKTAEYINAKEISDELVISFREQIKAMRSKGPYPRCDTCFTEVHRLFERQIDLMQALGMYRKSRGAEGDVAGIEAESVVQDILEPFANLQRFQIVKALSVQTRTFSEISGLTGLRGGNLLFHIRKLSDSGMIIQRHERGDYIITEKGFATLEALADLSRRVCGK